MKRNANMNRIAYTIFRIKGVLLKTGMRWDQQRLSADEVDQFAKDYLNEEPARIYNNGAQTLEYMLSQSGSSISERLREGEGNEFDNAIVDMVRNYQTKKDIIVYRGIPSLLLDYMFKTARGRKGIDLIDNGFMATSLVKESDLPGDVLLRIKVPSGINAIYMGDVGYEKEKYHEVTIQCGASLKIVSIDNEYINCELLSTC